MLSESFIASTISADLPGKSSVAKDVGIFIQGFQPNTAVKSTLKKSSTPPNCLGVSATHVFAAQADKAVVHVYSRERNNQEATVPFPERIQSVTFAGGDGGTGILVLGTQGGRIIVWEVGPSPWPSFQQDAQRHPLRRYARAVKFQRQHRICKL